MPRFHTARGHLPTPCLPNCRICELITPGSPHYREDYRRLFHPEDFASQDAERAKAEVEASRAAIVHPDLAPSPAPSPSPMLAGDLVAELTAYLGVDRATKWISKQIGINCGCDSRRAAMNRVDAKARSLLKRLAGRRPA